MNTRPGSREVHTDFADRGARSPLGARARTLAPRGAPGLHRLAGMCALIACCVLSGRASADGPPWGLEQTLLGEFQQLGDLGALSVDHLTLGFSDPPSQRVDGIASLKGGFERGAAATDPCLLERRPSVRADEHRLPGWASAATGDCGRSISRLDELIPRISIRGSFFSIGYGVELDKDSRTLLVDYGAFTLGVGDSPNGVAIFNGARFGLPHWLPGRRMLPRHVRDELQIEVGLSLVIDPVRPAKPHPQAGIGIRLSRW